MKCDWKGCDQDATHYPKVMVPATGLPIEGHEPIPTFIGLRCCMKHCKAFDIDTFFNSVGQDGMNPHKVMIQLLATERRPPDFARAFIQPVAFDTPEAMKFDQMRNDSNKPIPTGG